LIATESNKRSIVKALTYRAIATLLLAIISWIFTGDPLQTSIITILFTVFSTLAYFVHERIWTKISWGTILHDYSTTREKQV
jgi:adenylylsulfate kinase